MTMPVRSIIISDFSDGDADLLRKADGATPFGCKDGVLDIDEFEWAARDGIFADFPDLYNSVALRFAGLKPSEGLSSTTITFERDNLGHIHTIAIGNGDSRSEVEYTYDGNLPSQIVMRSGQEVYVSLITPAMTNAGRAVFVSLGILSGGDEPELVWDRWVDSAEDVPDIITQIDEWKRTQNRETTSPSVPQTISAEKADGVNPVPSALPELQAISTQFNNGGTDERQKAVRAAGQKFWTNPDGARIVISGLKDADYRVRAESARELRGKLGVGNFGVEAVDFGMDKNYLDELQGRLVSMLTDETDVLPRAEALMTLIQYDMSLGRVLKQQHEALKKLRTEAAQNPALAAEIDHFMRSFHYQYYTRSME